MTATAWAEQFPDPRDDQDCCRRTRKSVAPLGRLSGLAARESQGE